MNSFIGVYVITLISSTKVSNAMLCYSITIGENILKLIKKNVYTHAY